MLEAFCDKEDWNNREGEGDSRGRVKGGAREREGQGRVAAGKKVYGCMAVHGGVSMLDGRKGFLKKTVT